MQINGNRPTHGSPTQSGQHLSQRIDLALLHLSVMLPVDVGVPASITQVCGAGGSITALKIWRFLRYGRPVWTLVDRVELEVFGFSSARFPDGGRAKNVANGIRVLAPGQLAVVGLFLRLYVWCLHYMDDALYLFHLVCGCTLYWYSSYRRVRPVLQNN